MESIWSHKPLIQVLVFEYLPELTHCDRALSTLAAGFVMYVPFLFSCWRISDAFEFHRCVTIIYGGLQPPTDSARVA